MIVEYEWHLADYSNVLVYADVILVKRGGGLLKISTITTISYRRASKIS